MIARSLVSLGFYEIERPQYIVSLEVALILQKLDVLL